MICPCCHKPQKRTHFACQSGAKGGKVKSAAKSAAAKANAQKRWDAAAVAKAMSNDAMTHKEQK